MSVPLTANDGRLLTEALADEFPIEELRENRQIRFHVGTTDEHPGELEVRAWPAEIGDRVQAGLNQAGYPTRALPADDGVRVIVSPKRDAEV